MVTGEIEKSIQTYTLWAQSYPADDIPANNLGFDYSLIGQLDKALTQTQESLRLTPNSVIGYGNVMGIYLAPNRLDEAKAAFDKAIALKLDGPGLRITRYQLAFFQNDETAMQEQAAWILAKPSVQDQMLTALSDSEAYHGRLTKARELSQRALEAAKHNGSQEAAAVWQVNAALREAEFGNAAQARKAVAEALALNSDRDIQIIAALALARAGRYGAGAKAGNPDQPGVATGYADPSILVADDSSGDGVERRQHAPGS